MAIFDPDSDLVTGPLVAGAPEEPVLAADEIQGNVFPGFGTLHQAFLGIRFDASTVSAARRWLTSMAPSIATLGQVNDARNERRRSLRQGLERPTAPAWTNIAFDVKGVRLLAPAADKIRDRSFTTGMGIDSGLGDQRDPAAEGHPSRWVVGGTPENTPEILVIVGGDDLDEVRQRVGEVGASLASAGLPPPSFEQEGHVLDGQVEHFGFRDGLSQPGPRGRLSSGGQHYLTRRYYDPSDGRALTYARPGQPLVWPGQFVFGCPKQKPDDPINAGLAANGGHGWMDNGSYLVFRRLRQDVAELRRFTVSQAQALGIPAERLAALLVGRWPKGTSVLRNPAGDDPDPTGDSFTVNHFDFARDVEPADVCSDPLVQLESLAAAPEPELRTVEGAPGDLFGQVCPRFAHIRKVNPRGLVTDKGGPDRTLTFSILRRGIAWGVPYPSDPAEQATDDGQRGLLFLCYQTSIENQFRVLNTDWMNQAGAPEGDGGHDLLIGQGPGPERQRVGTLALDGDVPRPVVATKDWITSTGGGYFFAPSTSTLRLFAAGA